MWCGTLGFGLLIQGVFTTEKDTARGRKDMMSESRHVGRKRCRHGNVYSPKWCRR